MEQVWFSAALWLVLALVATMLSIWFRISTALSEIVVGTVAQLIIGALIGTEVLGAKSGWVSFLAGTGAIVLTLRSRPGVRRQVIAVQNARTAAMAVDMVDIKPGQGAEEMV